MHDSSTTLKSSERQSRGVLTTVKRGPGSSPNHVTTNTVCVSSPAKFTAQEGGCSFLPSHHHNTPIWVLSQLPHHLLFPKIRAWPSLKPRVVGPQAALQNLSLTLQSQLWESAPYSCHPATRNELPTLPVSHFG